MRRTRPCGSKSQLCRQEQGPDGADHAAETEAELVPPLNQESAGITAVSAMPLVGVPRHVRKRETTRPATSGDEFRWPSVESPVLHVRLFREHEFPGRHGCRRLARYPDHTCNLESLVRVLVCKRSTTPRSQHTEPVHSHWILDYDVRSDGFLS